MARLRVRACRPPLASEYPEDGVPAMHAADVDRPRLADLGEPAVRLNRGADYGVLNDLARNRIDRELIARN